MNASIVLIHKELTVKPLILLPYRALLLIELETHLALSSCRDS